MAAEYSANAVQTVNPGESVIFTNAPAPCDKGFVRHRSDSGSFMLAGRVKRYSCGCMPASANYLVDFGANIAIPEGGTVGPISLAIYLGGATVPTTQMIVTPGAVNEFENVSDATIVPVWRGCCESLTVRNTSDQAILVQNANIIFTRPDLYMQADCGRR
jgi:hypothetical protein